MKYDVHIFAVARVKVAGIAAQSQAEAIVKAEDSVDLTISSTMPAPCLWCGSYRVRRRDHTLSSG